MPYAFPKIKTRNYVILSIIALISLCTQLCTSRHPETAAIIRNNEGQLFAGSAACLSCHKDLSQQFIHTAHYLDSRPAAKQYIKGSFDDGKNHFVYNKDIEVVMEERHHRFYQTVFHKGEKENSEPFDIVIGSGRKGQTYLYWNDGKLFQLPVSYYTMLHDWCNSPGFPANAPYYNRTVPAYCLECHTTYAKTVNRQHTDGEDSFGESQIIYGIDCEKCHGPAAEHITFHTTHPTEKTGRYIINAARLSRQQQLDACALCHAGVRNRLRPAFSFKTGDKLSDYSISGNNGDSAANLDVHGNQYGLLSSSKCFRLSQMDCSSCHNVHTNEANSPRLFSERCMTCHNTSTHLTCTMPATPGLTLSDNCIDCHMPARPSQKILLALSNTGQTIHDFVRTHRIAIYTENTKEYLSRLPHNNPSKDSTSSLHPSSH